MTSQLNVDTIVDKAGSGGSNIKIANTSVTVAEGGSGTTTTVQGLCKGFMKYVGADDITNSSFNVASTTDTGTGKYHMNTTNAMGNYNTTTILVSSSKNTRNSCIDATGASSSKFGIGISNDSGSYADNNDGCVAILGDLA